ncbi:DNA primase, partial [Bacteroides uniformis]
HILSFLPNTEVTSRGNADRDALVGSMEEEFTRASFLQKAGEMGIKSETASTWLKRMQKHGLVENVDGKGNYRKPKV